MAEAPREDPNKAAFLERVRTALGRSEPLQHVPDHPPLKSTLPRHQEKLRTVHARVEARRPQLIARLAENAAGASWHVHRVQSTDDAATTVAEIASNIDAKRVVRSSEDVFKRIDVDAALRSRGVSPTILASSRSRRRSDLKEIAFRADLGVTGVDWVIAETASCVVIPRRGVARLTSLAPPVLAVIIEGEQVLESLDDLFAIVRLPFMQTRGKGGPPYFNFISGPSRTADIEQTLTVGVHGPGEVHMIIIG